LNPSYFLVIILPVSWIHWMRIPRRGSFWCWCLCCFLWLGNCGTETGGHTACWSWLVGMLGPIFRWTDRGGWGLLLTVTLALVIVQTGSHASAQFDLDHDSPIYAFQVAGMTSTCHHTQLFIGWYEVSLTFCLGWPQTMILIISTSQVARITCVSLHAQPTCSFPWFIQNFQFNIREYLYKYMVRTDV
jgi:hypothetical protein